VRQNQKAPAEGRGLFILVVNNLRGAYFELPQVWALIPAPFFDVALEVGNPVVTSYKLFHCSL